jgi:hypothetical protein
MQRHAGEMVATTFLQTVREAYRIGRENEEIRLRIIEQEGEGTAIAFSQMDGGR